MESVYENLKNHFRRKLSCFRLELLGFDLLKGVAVVLFTFLLFLFQVILFLVATAYLEYHI